MCEVAVIVSVGLCPLVYLKITRPNFTFSIRVARDRGLVILQRQRNTLCTSGSVDDVTFFHSRLYGIGNINASGSK